VSWDGRNKNGTKCVDGVTFCKSTTWKIIDEMEKILKGYRYKEVGFGNVDWI